MISEKQQKELLAMLPYSVSSGFARKQSEHVVPITAAERAAQRLLARQEKRREVVREKCQKKFSVLKSDAREAIYFGVDLKAALKKVKELRDFCRI